MSDTTIPAPTVEQAALVFTTDSPGFPCYQCGTPFASVKEFAAHIDGWQCEAQKTRFRLEDPAAAWRHAMKVLGLAD